MLEQSFGLTFFLKNSKKKSNDRFIYLRVLAMALQQGRLFGIKVSRSKIMAKSHVNTLPTYRKYFKELQGLGYISYRPSYHPGVRSEVDFLKQP